MQIIPAIDLKDGYAVRLKQGDMQSAKIYDKNPLNLCAIFEDLGAEYLHIVDLDGAFLGRPKNRAIIERISFRKHRIYSIIIVTFKGYIVAITDSFQNTIPCIYFEQFFNFRTIVNI